jgi:hypothetical protein
MKSVDVEAMLQEAEPNSIPFLRRQADQVMLVWLKQTQQDIREMRRRVDALEAANTLVQQDLVGLRDDHTVMTAMKQMPRWMSWLLGIIATGLGIWIALETIRKS